MTRIFISYSRKDSDFARQLAADLDRLGADVWIDIQDITSGINWSNAIQEALDTAEVMLLIVSPDSMASGNVQDEWQYFKDLGRLLVPILWQPAKLHFQLHRLQHVDFHTQAYQAALTRLCEELNGKGVALDTPRSTPAAPSITLTPPPGETTMLSPAFAASVATPPPVSDSFIKAQTPQGFWLIMRRGPFPDQVYQLANAVITLGRDLTNDIVINDPELSRHHSRLTQGSTGYILEDLGSTNGTYVNGQRLTRAHTLAPGDMVGMGETVTLQYGNTEADRAAPVFPPPAAPLPKFRLAVKRGPQPGTVYSLEKTVITLGRDITNDIVINDPELSRNHCRLTQGNSGYLIEDLGSTNGTFINGQRLKGNWLLTPGDAIGLGETVTLVYE